MLRWLMRRRIAAFEREYQWRVEPAQVNGAPGLMLREPDGAAETIAFDIADGRIAGLYIVLNPEKLRHIAV